MSPTPKKHKTKRLTRTSDFRRVYQKGALFKSPNIRLYIQQVPTDSIRLGVVVSKRVSKHATTRNRIRRIVKEWFLRSGTEAHSPGKDIVISVQSFTTIGAAGSKALRAELQVLNIKALKK